MRPDNNQKEIVDGLRGMGASVQILSQVGGGCPDLVVGFRGKSFLLEVKEPGGMLRDKQRIWFDTWKGHAAVVHNLIEALKAIGATK